MKIAIYKPVFLLLIATFLATPVMAKDPFERPAELETDISFWRRVFAEIDSNQAFLHDSRHLDIVYETVHIPENATPTRRRRIADLARARYRKALNKLAKGDRNNLNGEEKRILLLWPADISNKELKQAAKRIRFQQGLADRFVEGLKRSGAWKPHIKEQLRKAKVPVGLAALPHVESSFNPDARSHVGAAGLWQFTRGTGRRFMEIDHVVDERRDPFLSSAAAAELIAYNYSILESWPLAITAYNHGVAGMRRAVRKLKTEDIAVINREYNGRTFGFASRNFYLAFLAALEVEQNASQYFGDVVQDTPRADLLVTTKDYVPAEAMAAAMGVSTKKLRRYNPALLEPVWEGTKHIPQGFPLRIPQSLADMTAGEVLAAIPVSQRFAMQTPDMHHKVRSGESLSVIATRYNTSISQLVALNGLKSRHRIRAGQTLRLPFAGVSISEGAETYKVRNGDSISKIASRSGVSESSLMRLNNLANKNRIYVGQVLYLRATEVPTPAAKQAINKPEKSIPTPELAVAKSRHENQPPAVAVPSPAPFEVSLADPNDYSVAADNTIEIQPAETLGHYADWLDISTQQLRNLNGMSRSKPVVVGRRIKLDFGQTGSAEFTKRRITHHRTLQEAFFANYRVTATTEHKVERGESLWLLTLKRYKVPVWLLRQYNPDLNFGQVRPGMRIVFPRIERVEKEAKDRRSLADIS
ncbi:MAG: lytic transglycosylase [Chromatiales bacterium]|nr:lytic transglycosylase [Chromatiales bacterium]MDP6151305.1 LysM peptidoglycan-binding domain-containing protein [Gammaproteobacteria bacterium]HJP05265.1 LysM peptidoglycan-binding domain-containing protein [Gammaproteobacteria bacterium]